MKKKVNRHNRRNDRDTMRPEYDFSSAVRGVTAARYAQGANIAVIDSKAWGGAMPQNQASGAAANKWGRETARQIAPRIGAVMLGSGSNEATFGGKRVVIKCAARKTNSVGVTFKMLEALDAVIGAFQLDDGSFEVWSLPSDVFRAEMRNTRSRGRAAGKVGLVRRAVFSNRGTLVGRVRADWM
jgi:hypothetical protein